MTELTSDAGRKLKRGVALRLGRMVMEFSRLETEVGLALYGSAAAHARADVALALRRADFSARLAMLRRHLAAQPHVHPDYSQWARDADAARRLRNRLIHGRWDFRDPDAREFTNVRGDPFSDERSEVTMTLAELDAQLEQLKALRRRLAALRKTAPLPG
jgi:hypothetical protein